MSIVLRNRIKCDQCPIRHRAVCSRCEGAELTALENMKSYRSFAAGEPIMWRGDELSYVATVVQGVATLSKTMEDGRTQMVGLLLPSDFIGRPGRKEIEFDVVAATDVTLCCFDLASFEHLLVTTPHLAHRMIEIALDELDAARDWMLLLGRKTAKEKIATFILMLVRRQGLEGVEGKQPALALPLIREEIADYLGLTLETVSRQFSALKSACVLEFSDRKHFRVLDEQALAVASGD